MPSTRVATQPAHTRASTDAAAQRRPLRIAVVYGTRPEAVKMAPLVRALAAHPEIDVDVIVTGQHREMLHQVNEVFGVVPTVDLDICTPGQTLTDVTCATLRGLEPVFAGATRPDAVLVQGDTTTTFAAGLAAFYAKIPVVHTEAGLRTDDVYSPYPEEMNRRITTRLASLHLAPTPLSRSNLLADGVDPSTIVVTGNSVIDALLWAVSRPAQIHDEHLAERLALGRRVVLVTAHRRESWGEPMRAIGRALAKLATRHPDVDIVFPVHRNPLVREAILPLVEHLPNVIITEPQPYGQFCHLMNRAYLILSDSGGVQEEGPSLGKPVLVMRDNTERPEATTAGTARLVGTDETTIVTEVSRLLTDRAAYDAMAQAVNPYGDGETAQRTVAAILHAFGRGPRAEEFVAGATSGTTRVAVAEPAEVAS